MHTQHAGEVFALFLARIACTSSAQLAFDTFNLFDDDEDDDDVFVRRGQGQTGLVKQLSPAASLPPG